jgi:hypothetical protein
MTEKKIGVLVFTVKILLKYNIEGHILKLKRVYKIETQSIRECVREKIFSRIRLGRDCVLRNKPEAGSVGIPNSRITSCKLTLHTPTHVRIVSSFARMRVPKFACEIAYDAGFGALTYLDPNIGAYGRCTHAHLGP